MLDTHYVRVGEQNLFCLIPCIWHLCRMPSLYCQVPAIMYCGSLGEASHADPKALSLCTMDFDCIGCGISDAVV